MLIGDFATTEARFQAHVDILGINKNQKRIEKLLITDGYLVYFKTS